MAGAEDLVNTETDRRKRENWLDAQLIFLLSCTRFHFSGFRGNGEIRSIEGANNGAGGGNRTHGLGIMRPSLFH